MKLIDESIIKGVPVGQIFSVYSSGFPKTDFMFTEMIQRILNGERFAYINIEHGASVPIMLPKDKEDGCN